MSLCVLLTSDGIWQDTKKAAASLRSCFCFWTSSVLLSGKRTPVWKPHTHRVHSNYILWAELVEPDELRLFMFDLNIFTVSLNLIIVVWLMCRYHPCCAYLGKRCQGWSECQMMCCWWSQPPCKHWGRPRGFWDLFVIRIRSRKTQVKYWQVSISLSLHFCILYCVIIGVLIANTLIKCSIIALVLACIGGLNTHYQFKSYWPHTQTHPATSTTD